MSDIPVEPFAPLAETVAAESGRRRRLATWRVPPWLRAGAPAWIWFGVAAAALGFVLLAIAWGGVAPETQVHLQIPYVVSAGLVGLGVIMVGLTALNIASRQQDAIERDKQIDQLVAAIDELKETLAAQQAKKGR